MPPFVAGFRSNEVTLEELAAHRLTVEDAEDVLDGRPKFLPDKGNRARRRLGYRQRWMMVGPGADGTLLTFVIDEPDADRIAHLVTGWRSSRGERSRYHQPGGKRNRP